MFEPTSTLPNFATSDSKATVTPKLRPGYDRFFLESLSNRRENVPLVVVVVGDRNQSQNQSQQGRRSCSKLQSCDYKSQTGLK